jgi:hypothetical protein
MKHAISAALSAVLLAGAAGAQPIPIDDFAKEPSITSLVDSTKSTIALQKIESLLFIVCFSPVLSNIPRCCQHGRVNVQTYGPCL